MRGLHAFKPFRKYSQADRQGRDGPKVPDTRAPKALFPQFHKPLPLHHGDEPRGRR